MNQVIFYSADRVIPIKERRKHKVLIQRLFELENSKLEQLSFIFCSDEYVLQLNLKYLNHNFYTDILTFLISDFNHPIISEIYMSTERIKENAKTFNVSYQRELLRVMIHGALHLCGYDDTNGTAKKKMQKKEDFYIQLYADSRET